MFDVNQEIQDFNNTRGDSLAASTKKMRDQILFYFYEFCKNEYYEDFDSIVSKLYKNPEAGYGLLKKYKEFELGKGNSIKTIKVKCHYVRQHLKRNGITLEDKDKIKDIFGKIPKHSRDAVTHDDIERLLLCCDHKLRSIILVQSSSGLRIGELLGLKAGDLSKNERYKIKIRADNTKTRTERISFVSKEAEPYLEFYLKNKSKDELIFNITKSGITGALQRALSKANLEKRYDHSNQRTISSHSFRAFFITQMGKMEGFFGHALAGHDHYMAQYDRYSVDELLEKYLEGEAYLQIFNRMNTKKVKDMEKEIQMLREKVSGFEKYLGRQINLKGEIIG